ncbi:MAG TPA: SsrA-binding protein SmpB [Phototrophicaceae bacterium]|jgi:SsrA-binding protein|nr:SsrA-binding protein SmpB [Phototrophicaceae bacterium]
MSGQGRKIVTRNRKASHEYHLSESYDAGIVLTGTEIKSIRGNQINLNDGFVEERDGELWLLNVHISPYKQASRFDANDPIRPRKLLLHKKEIARIIDKLRERGFTVVPTSVYLERGMAKVEIALAKGKKLYDKRDTIAKRDAEREIQRALKDNY